MKSKLKTISVFCKKRTAYIFILPISLLPMISNAQPAPPGPGGGNPDTPLSAPFDDNMNMMLLAAGIIFAIVILKKAQKQRQLLMNALKK